MERLLEENRRNYLERNRRSGKYILKELTCELPDLGHQNYGHHQIQSIAANNTWIAAVWLDGWAVAFNTITNNRKVLEPSAGYRKARVAMNESTGAVLTVNETRRQGILKVFDEDWIEQRVIEFQSEDQGRFPYDVDISPIVTEKSLVFISDYFTIKIFSKGTNNEYDHAHTIVSDNGERFYTADANDDVVVTSFRNKDFFKIWSTDTGQLVKTLTVGVLPWDFTGMKYNKVTMVGTKIAFYSFPFGPIHENPQVRTVDWLTEEQEVLPW